MKVLIVFYLGEGKAGTIERERRVFMFSKGDKVVYPMYGAGEIEDIEEKMIDGISQSYYIIRIPNGNLKIMVSVKKADTVGLREVFCGQQVFQMIETAAGLPVIMTENWNQRYKENMEKIRTGQLSEVAEVVRNLLLRERNKGLSSAEKKMLNNAKQIIISEIVYSSDVDKAKAEELLAKSLLNC